MIQFTEEMRAAVNNALTERVPIHVAYVDPDGMPSISLRGTLQVWADDQLALWARNPEGGMPRAIATNPKIAIFYRNPEKRVSWQFYGRAHVTEDAAARNRIFDASPEVERNQDPQRAGKAIIVEVDRVVSRGQTLMER